MVGTDRALAVVTGASTGIGYELARKCATEGFDLVIAADEPAIQRAADDCRAEGAMVDAVQADFATLAGVDQLYAELKGRPVAALLANAGRGLGHGFLDQNFNDIRHVVDTNVTGTIYLIHKVGKDMRPHPHHRFDCRIRSRHISGRLQRQQGVPGFIFLRVARRAEGHGHHRDMSDAGRD